MTNKVQLTDSAGEVTEVSKAIANIVDGALMTNDEGIFFARQLEHIQAKTYDVLYPELKGRSLFSTNTEGGEGVTNFTWRSFDKRGKVKIIAGKATDLPRSAINGKEYTSTVRTLGGSYGYSRQEIAAAKMTGMPLDSRLAEATRRAYEEEINQLIFFGSEEHGLNGLFGGVAGGNWSHISNTQVAAAAGGANATEWGVDKTPDEVIADLNAALIKMVVDTKQVFRPNQILMSVAKRNYLMTTPRSLQSDMSIMNWFIANNDFISSPSDIIAINELDNVFGAVPGFNAGSQGFIVRATGDDNVICREPFPFTPVPVQYKGLEFEINNYGRFGGVVIYRPESLGFYYGV